MKSTMQTKARAMQALMLVAPVLMLSSMAFAHCDSLDGPVIQDARLALTNNNVNPVLKWVDKKDEGRIIEVFTKTVALRSNGGDIREMVDNYFFETLVRIHRESEGEGFTGLKPAGSVDPGIDAADQALETGDGTELAKKISNVVYEGIRKRFEVTMKKKKQANKSVEDGREYVNAYVQYVHLVEQIHLLVSHGAEHKHQQEKDH